MAEVEQVVERKHLSGQAFIFLFWLFVTGVGLSLTPDPSGHGTHTQLGMPPCPSALIMDRPCPGCGLTTSFTALLHGDFSAAFSAHLLGPALYATITVYALLAFALFLKRQPLVLSVGVNRLMTYAMVGFLIYGIGRAVMHPGFGGSPESRYVKQYFDRATSR